jgi:tetratricopeptide (TPR) repeat protein
MHRNALIFAAALSITLIIIFVVLSKGNEHESTAPVAEPRQAQSQQIQPDRKANKVILEKPRYVGAKQCTTCHASQYTAWQGSHHDLAMQEATLETVLGDFNNAQFEYYGSISSFYTKDGLFYVKTPDEKGALTEYRIRYTFGVTPLQQYLIEFPGGRYQVLSIAWDTRPKAQGGQRWFHLYPNENIEHTDPLYWTGVYQNWNIMCAECHSTNLQKNYNYGKDAYQTVWSEIDVSCEACHGPASNHIRWAQEYQADPQQWADVNNKGLVISLTDINKGQWEFEDKAKVAKRNSQYDTRIQLETCARCHARRGVFNDDYRHGEPFMNTHVPALLTDELYFADGQIMEEVYVYGSFLQSKMHKAGVVCSDCHDPHSLKLKAPGNAVCTQCHAPDRYDTTEHHHHKPNTASAMCVECHMPETTYMVVDPRRDHSIRIPRPDLSVKLKTPNACNRCHSEKAAAWASNAVDEWYGNKDERPTHYGEILHAARNGQPQADIDLAELILDKTQPGIVRATAMSLLRNYSYPKIESLLDQVYKDPDPLVRNAVAEYLGVVDPSARVKHASALIQDPVRAVRMNAARVLLDTPADLLKPEQQRTVQRTLEELISAQQYNTDRPEGRTALGNIYTTLGDYDKAEAYFKAAIDVGPALAQAYVNLADLYRVQQREQDADEILRLGLKQSDNRAPIHHALGLSFVRQQKMDAALGQLKRAAELAPDQSRYAYVYGVALQSKGYGVAISYLEKAAKRHPGDLNILFTLASYYYENGNRSAAMEYAERVLVLAPQHRGARQLMLILNQ